MVDVGQRIFDRDCRGCFMHKQGLENEGAPTILQRIQDTLY